MSSSLRRLAADHASLRRSELPPNYLFPLNRDSGVLPDDLNQLTILLTGARGTPYAQGLWQLQLRIPTDYPKNPPKAIFKTRMWHPNVEESTGAVCLETLKRDWDPRLTLRDILVTISCLLIHPNPDSALNSAAGSLLQGDYEAFAEQARLMTSIHARIPSDLKPAVDAARRRGEEEPSNLHSEKEAAAPVPRMSSRPGSTLQRKKLPSSHSRPSPLALTPEPAPSENHEFSDDEEDHDPSKENDPSQSPLLVIQSPRSPRKNILGKRPLSELPTPADPEEAMTESEKNIAVNQRQQNAIDLPPKKSPKLTISGPGVNAAGSQREETSARGEATGAHIKAVTTSADEENESLVRKGGEGLPEMSKIPIRVAATSDASLRSTLRKVSNLSSSKGKQLPRIGIRRL